MGMSLHTATQAISSHSCTKILTFVSQRAGKWELVALGDFGFLWECKRAGEGCGCSSVEEGLPQMHEILIGTSTCTLTNTRIHKPYCTHHTHSTHTATQHIDVLIHEEPKNKKIEM